MAELKRWYLICYDIRDPKRWRKAHSLVQGYGERLQYSVFRCKMSLRQREKLRWELEKILTQEDDLMLVGICNRCEQRIPQYNRESAWVQSVCEFRLF